MTDGPGAVGLVECRGLVAVMVAVEAMSKAARVRCLGIDKVSSGVLAAAVTGDLASVQAAVAAAEDAVRRFGQSCVAQVYARPAPEMAHLLPASEFLGGAHPRDGRRHV